MRIEPARAAFCGHAGDEDAALLSLTLLADTETPISAFHRLGGGQAGQGPSLLLESVEGGERMARYSFLAANVGRTLRLHGAELQLRDGDKVETRTLGLGPGDGPLDAVRAAVPVQRLWSPRPLPRLCAGAVGLFAFDCVRFFEPVPLAPARSDAPPTPDVALLMPDVLVAYDHVQRQMLLMTVASLGGDAAARDAAWQRGADRLAATVARLRAGTPPEPWPLLAEQSAPDAAGAPPRPTRAPLQPRPNQSRATFEAAVAKAQEAIAAGEVFQVVLSQRFDVDCAVAPLELYRALRAVNPSPYMFLLDLGDMALVGASPEVLVRVEDGDVLVRPIAGTRRRGATDAEDAALAADLLADPKELAEHRMLLDLGRNDVGRVARIGSVVVDDPLHIERYSHVLHMVSDVHGALRPGCDALDALAATFPAGTVSGAPKVRAMELIAALEPDRRGAYAGAVGYLDVRGNLDTAIAIRTMVVRDGVVSVQAGAGIVADSVPASEFAECEAKARAAIAAIGLAVAHAGEVG